MRRELQRQLVRLENRVAHEIRQRHLGRRNQKVLVADRKKVTGELWQLARAEERRTIREIRDIGLAVAVLARVQVEHELDQRPMQSRQIALENGEAAAGDFRRGGEIEHAETLADRLMVARLEAELARLADAPDLGVGGLVGAFGHVVVQQVRNAVQQAIERERNLLEALLPCRQLVAELADLAAQRLDVLAGRLGLADRLRFVIAGLPARFDLDLQRLALGLEGVECGPVEGETPPREIRSHGIDVLPQELEIQHADRSGEHELLDAPAPALEEKPGQRKGEQYTARIGGSVEWIEAATRSARLRQLERETERTADERQDPVPLAPAEPRKPEREDEVREGVHRLVAEGKSPFEGAGRNETAHGDACDEQPAEGPPDQRVTQRNHDGQ